MLIDKSELLKAYDEAHNGPPGKARELIEEAPGVEAVPLDKLCEWLAEYAAPPVTECCVTSDERTAAWKAVLNKFVEEQDAAD